MKGAIPMRSQDEYDALTKNHHAYHWKPRDRKRIKRGYNKRVRRVMKREMNYHEDAN